MKQMKKGDKNKSALSVSKGVEQPPSVDPDSLRSFKTRRRNRLSPGNYIEGILGGNISYLSQAITLIESSLPGHQDIAMELVEKCLPYSGNSVRMGITGVPGAGKSTFIESFGRMLINNGSRLAVLAVDPSSQLTKGSILGDKTRMEKLSSSPSAFIRPSPSGGTLGGVARKTRESIILCEAAGFDFVIIETVGVGQSETAVKSMVDFFLLLMLPGAGDELQGIKRGIMEMADAIAVTKSDGDNLARALTARSQYEVAVNLYPSPASGWKTRVHTCSSVTGEGLAQIHGTLSEYLDFVRSSDYFTGNRKNQSLYWMYESIDSQLTERFYNDPFIAGELDEFRKEVVEGSKSSFLAARQLLEKYHKRR
jgi:LAO/AO transport system kinase